MFTGDSVFKKSFPKALRVPLMVLALLPHLMLLSLFNMNSTFTASFLDVEADDIQFLFSMAYASIICGLFIHIRFFYYFNLKSYLLFMTCVSILILLAMTLTKNTQLILVLRLLQGPITLFEGCILLPIIMSQIKSSHAKIIAYCILYCFMMTGDKFTTSMVKFAIENYNHNMLIYVVIFCHVLALLVFLIAFNHKRMFPKMPLYQLNLAGILLLLISLISGAYFLIYGKKYDWFDSLEIVLAFCLMLIFGGLFILYQITSKRPLFNFQVFNSKPVLIGIVLFFIFYVMRASLSNLYQVMGNVWQWPWTHVLDLQYINVAGTITGTLCAVFFLLRKTAYRYVLSLGFLLMALSMWIFSQVLNVDIIQSTIYLPLFLEGLAQGIIFTPLFFYMLGSVRPNLSANVSLVGTSIRFWSTTIGFSLMQNLLLHIGTRKQYYLSADLDPTNPNYQAHWTALLQGQRATLLEMDAVSVATTRVSSDVINQALLLINMDIFRVLSYIGVSVGLFCFCYEPLKMVFRKCILKYPNT